VGVAGRGGALRGAGAGLAAGVGLTGRAGGGVGAGAALGEGRIHPAQFSRVKAMFFVACEGAMGDLAPAIHIASPHVMVG
jgi:hypothetical protein